VHLCTAFSEIPFSLAKSKQSLINSRFARFLLANALLGSQQATAAIRKEVHFERYSQIKVARVAVVAVKHRKRRGGTQTTMKTITKGALASPGRSGTSAAVLVTPASAIALADLFGRFLWGVRLRGVTRRCGLWCPNPYRS
jgi:hypothetical protein